MKENRFDKIGIVSSVLCLLHCLVVPIGMVFALELEVLHHWQGWTALQVVFIVIAAWAVSHAAKHAARPFIKWTLWLGVALLVVALFLGHDEQEAVNYLAAALLIGAHSVNLFLNSHRPAIASTH